MSTWTDLVGTGIAKYPFAGQNDGQLTLQTGDKLHVLKENSGWYRGYLFGQPQPPQLKMFPASYVDFTPEPLVEVLPPPPLPPCLPSDQLQPIFQETMQQEQQQQQQQIQEELTKQVTQDPEPQIQQQPEPQVQQQPEPQQQQQPEPQIQQQQQTTTTPATTTTEQPRQNIPSFLQTTNTSTTNNSGSGQVRGKTSWVEFNSFALAKFKFETKETNQLALKVGDKIEITSKNADWYRGHIYGSNNTNTKTMFPANYVALYNTRKEMEDAWTAKYNKAISKSPAKINTDPAPLQIETLSADQFPAMAGPFATQNVVSPSSPVTPSAATTSQFSNTTTNSNNNNNNNISNTSNNMPLLTTIPQSPTGTIIIPPGTRKPLKTLPPMSINATVSPTASNQTQASNLSRLMSTGQSSPRNKAQNNNNNNINNNGNINNTSSNNNNNGNNNNYIPGQKYYQLSFAVNLLLFSCLDDLEVFFGLYSNVQQRFITDEAQFLIPGGNTSLVTDNVKLTFADLTFEDLSSTDLFLCARFYRKGSLILPTTIKDKAKTTPPTPLRRPFGVAVTPIQLLTLQPFGTQFVPQHFQVYEAINEQIYTHLHQTLISYFKTPGSIPNVEKTADFKQLPQSKGIASTFKLFEGDLPTVIQANPKAKISEMYIVRKTIVPHPIPFSTDLPLNNTPNMSTLFITLVGCNTLNDKKARNIEIRVRVVKNQHYKEVPGVIYRGTVDQCVPLDIYRSCVYYRTNTPKMNETFIISTQTSDLLQSHLLFELWHHSETSDQSKTHCFGTGSFQLTTNKQNGKQEFIPNQIHIVNSYKPYLNEMYLDPTVIQTNLQPRIGESISFRSCLVLGRQ